MAGSGWRGHGLTSREAGNVAAKPDFPFQQVPELDIERSPVVYVLVDTIVEDKMVSADVTHNFPGFWSLLDRQLKSQSVKGGRKTLLRWLRQFTRSASR